jgi:hypothetical protein
MLDVAKENGKQVDCAHVHIFVDMVRRMTSM